MAPPARASVLAAALVLSSSRPAHALADAAASATQAEGTVDVTLTGDDDPQLRDAVRELLSRLHLVVTAPGAPAAPGSEHVASVRIDLSSRTDALIVVTDAATGEVRLRRTVPRDATAPIVREEIAHAVQSAVEAALVAARDRAAEPPPAPPPPAPPPIVLPPPAAPVVKEEPRPAPAPARYGLELATLAGAGPVADGAGLTSRIGLGASAVSRAFLRPSFALSLLFAVPFDTGDAQLVAAHTTMFSLRAMPAVSLYRGAWLSIDLGAGGGFDTITVAPHSATLPPSNVNEQTTRVDAILSSMLTAHARVAPGVVFLLSGGVDVDLDSRQYVFAQGAEEAQVFAPWRVRPMVLAGFGFTALGDGFFPSHAGGSP
jgi:hypothetical protein